MDGNAIKGVVEEYLDKEHTDYAIMIDGVWGCGKSFFVENDLACSIRNIDCPYIDPTKKYIPIVYSLYGAESAEKILLDIRREITLSTLEPDNKKKKTFHKSHPSKAESVISTIIGGLADYFGIDSKRLLPLFNLINIPRNIVLIFDGRYR